VPRYDFRCDACGLLFELTRSFGQSAAPAACPDDGASATRLFSPPLDLLMYGREPIVDTRRPTIPPGALSCHDHGPPAGATTADADASGRHPGSRWHAHGYEGTSGGGAVTHSHGPGYSHSHAYGRGDHRH
jgi:putative FmdB family regulatory protein